MQILPSIGRIGYAVVMAYFGLGHFLNTEVLAGYVPGYFPVPSVFVYLTGIGLIAAAVAIIINKQAKNASLLLGLMLVLFAVLIHLPSFADSPAGFLKDMGLGMGAWAMSGQLKN